LPVDVAANAGEETVPVMSMVKSATQTRTVRPVCAVTCRRLALSTKLDRVGTWIATSGLSYEHWQDVLYHGCPPADRLAPYVAEFDTVELNASFYRWPDDHPADALDYRITHLVAREPASPVTWETYKLSKRDRPERLEPPPSLGPPDRSPGISR
jgi:hypothetical protein